MVFPPIPPGEASLFYAPVESSATTGDTFAVGYTALFVSRDNCARRSRLPFPGPRTAASALYIPNGDHVYVGTIDGRIFTTSWDGTEWKTMTPLASARPGVLVSDLYVDLADPATLWLTNSKPGFGVLDGSCVWRSGDGGKIWTSRSTGLPPLPINAIAVDPEYAERIWLAADLGVYESSDSGQTWHPFSTGLPNAFIGHSPLPRPVPQAARRHPQPGRLGARHSLFLSRRSQRVRGWPMPISPSGGG